MLDLLLHGLLFANLAGVVIVATHLTGKAFFPANEGSREEYWVGCLLVVVLNLLFVGLVAAVAPSSIITPDGARYMFEIREIAAAPWEWDPFAGRGPNYEVTAKMGMSYLYGLVLFVHQVDSLAAVLALNVLFSWLTGIAVFLLARSVSDNSRIAIAAMVLTALFPETLFWSARVARENVTLFLLPAFVYCCLAYFRSFRWRYLLAAAPLFFVILLTRAQLALFAVLVLVYFVGVSLGSRQRAKVLLGSALGAGALYLVFPLVEMQIARAVGRGFLEYVSLDVGFWLAQWQPLLENAAAVLTPAARGGYGPLGLLIAPFVLLGFALVAFSLLRLRAIFGDRAPVAGLLLFLACTFLAMLAVAGVINIRFRSTVAPLLLPIVTVAAVHLWRRAGLPRLQWA